MELGVPQVLDRILRSPTHAQTLTDAIADLRNRWLAHLAAASEPVRPARAYDFLSSVLHASGASQHTLGDGCGTTRELSCRRGLLDAIVRQPPDDPARQL